MPAYLWVDGDGIAISATVDRLLELGAPRDLDLDALAGLLGGGFLSGTDTVFRHIRSVPPACVLEWTAGKLTIESRPTWPRLADLTRDQAIEGVIELTRQAVARRSDDDRAVRLQPLSGGRDTRHIVLELRRQDRLPERFITTAHYPYD